MEIDKEVVDYLKQCSSVISKHNYQTLYNNALMRVNYPSSYKISQMTYILKKSGIEPLKYMTFVPSYYAINDEDIKHVIIPDNVESIGRYAFSGCKSLHTVDIKGNLLTIHDNAFDGCKNLDKINFQGSTEQWRNIKKGFLWNCDTPDFLVYCKDGVLDANMEDK